MTSSGSIRGSGRSSRSVPRTPGMATNGRAGRLLFAPEQQTHLQSAILQPEEGLLRRRALLALSRVDRERWSRNPSRSADQRAAGAQLASVAFLRPLR